MLAVNGRQKLAGSSITPKGGKIHLQRCRMARTGWKTFSQYYDACKLVVDNFGKGTHVDALKPTDFTRFRSMFPETWGLEMLNGVIGRVAAT